MTKQSINLRNIYRFIMLLEDDATFSIEDYKTRTFKEDAEGEDPEKLKKNMEIFNSYVLGGVEVIYQKFNDCDTKKAVANRLNEFLEIFISDNSLKA